MAEDNTLIRGYLISQPHQNDSYKRYPWIKLYDKFVYKQHVTDVNNILRIKTKDGRIVTIRFYGIVDGGISRIDGKMEITAEGRFNQKNEWIASRIFLDGSELNMQTQIQDYLYSLGPFFLIALLYILSTSISRMANVASTVNDSEVNGSIKDVALIWIIMSSLAMWIEGRFMPRMRFSNRLTSGAVIGVLLTVLYYYWF